MEDDTTGSPTASADFFNNKQVYLWVFNGTTVCELYTIWNLQCGGMDVFRLMALAITRHVNAFVTTTGSTITSIGGGRIGNCGRFDPHGRA